MTTYCECGDVATLFATADGDPLPEPMCQDCWFYQLTMHEQYLPEQRFHDPPIAAEALASARSPSGDTEV
jgi:hypothetical protein